MSNPSKSPNVIVHPESQDLLDAYLGEVEKVLVEAKLSELEVDNLIVDVFHSILDLSTKYLPPQGPYHVTRPILHKVLEELGDPRDVARTFLDEYRSVSNVTDNATTASAPHQNVAATSPRVIAPSAFKNNARNEGRSIITFITEIFLSPWFVDTLFAMQAAIALLQLISLIMLDPSFFFLDNSYPFEFFSDKFELLVYHRTFLSILMFFALLLATYVALAILCFHSIRLKQALNRPCNVKEIMRFKQFMDALMLFLSLVIFWYLFSASSFIWNALTPYNSTTDVVLGKIAIFSFGILIIISYFLLKTLDWSTPARAWQQFKAFRNASLHDILAVFSLSYGMNSKSAIEPPSENKLSQLHRLARVIQLLSFAMMSFPLLYAIIFLNTAIALHGGFWISFHGPFLAIFLFVDILIRLKFLHENLSIRDILSSSIEQWMPVINVVVHAIGVMVVVALTQNVILALIILGADLYWLEKTYQTLRDSSMVKGKQPSSGMPVTSTKHADEMRTSVSRSTLVSTESSQPVPYQDSELRHPVPSHQLAVSLQPAARIVSIQEYKSSSENMGIFKNLMISLLIAVFYSLSLITVLTAMVYEILVLWVISPMEITIIDVYGPTSDPILSSLPFSPNAVFAFALLLQFIYLVMAVYHRVTARPLSLSFRVVTYLMVLLILIPVVTISYALYMAVYYKYDIYLRVSSWDYFIFIVGSAVFNFLIMIEKRQIKSAIKLRKKNATNNNKNVSVIARERELGI